MKISKDLILGTQNPGKIQEFHDLLEGFPITLRDLRGLDIGEPEENGVTFLDNALIKAKAYATHFNAPVLADDSGLCIDALDQKPGVHTKPFVEELGGYHQSFEKLEELLKDHIDGDKNIWPTATMHCVLVLAQPDGHYESFHGIVEGHLKFPPFFDNNNKSFGVDPIFVPKGHDKSFAEDMEMKHQVSHRKKALLLLKDYLQKNV